MAGFSQAEDIIISAKPTDREVVKAVLNKYRYQVLRVRKSNITIRVPEVDQNYAGFLLELFEAASDVNIIRKGKTPQATTRFSVNEAMANNEAIALIQRLEDVGAHVSKIGEDAGSFIEIKMSAEKSDRVRMELQLITKLVPLTDQNTSSKLNKSSCELFFP